MLLDEDSAREMRMQWNDESGGRRIVNVQMFHGETGTPSFMYQYDEDGDAVLVEEDWCFDHEGLVNVKFPKGTSPALVARALRKCAAMFEGEHAHDLANLGG